MKFSRIAALTAALIAGAAHAEINAYPYGLISYDPAANAGTVIGFGDWSDSYNAKSFTFDTGSSFNTFTFKVNNLQFGTVDDVILNATSLTNGGAGVWSLSSPVTFAANTDTFLTIKFTGSNPKLNFGGSFNASTVSAVPEPETYAMLLAGLGVVGFMARRRKSA